MNEGHELIEALNQIKKEKGICACILIKKAALRWMTVSL